MGGQSYWNAEATMTMHCRGILIMTDRGTMVLTGKRALDFSDCVSAEDNLALGGFAHIMGPNGQAHGYGPTSARPMALAVFSVAILALTASSFRVAAVSARCKQ